MGRMLLRPLEEQFAANTVVRIRAILERLDRIPFPDGGSRYFAVEAARALEAGVLLGALSLAASLLELTIRGLVVLHARAASRPGKNLQAALEEKREVGFAALVDALVNVDLFDPYDGGRAKTFYRELRIPVHHGLPNRLLQHHYDSWFWDLRLLIRNDEPVGSGELEDFLDSNALDQIDAVVGILERNRG